MLRDNISKQGVEKKAEESLFQTAALNTHFKAINHFFIQT